MEIENGITVVLALLGIGIVAESYGFLGKNASLLFTVAYLIVVPVVHEGLVRTTRGFSTA